MADSVTVEHLGCPGHLIVSRYCRWRRHTQIDGPCGSFRVSTLGDYYQPGPNGSEVRATVAGGRADFFETMVFRTVPRRLVAESEGCGCREVEDWSEIDAERNATAGQAQAGHERLVAKYARLAARNEVAHG